MAGQKIGKKATLPLTPLEFSGLIWVDYDFKSTGLSRADLASNIFTRCHFDNVDFYWCHAFNATFIDCKFVKSDLRGSFDQTRFVRCGFDHCKVGDNELGGKTEWTNAVAVECVVAGDPLPIVEADPLSQG